ncbi:MAG: nitrophenyl compound nitroreductase subunit ArsF family protein [Candidatus Omnitrophota bacterium]
MKKTFCLILLFAILCVPCSFGFSEDMSIEDKVIVYYFHGIYRCMTCNAMEAYSKEAVETNFKDELNSGTLEFESINVEDKANEHFVEDYGLYTKSLILSRVVAGEEVESKNLDKIWEYSRNKNRFITYITEELNEFLEEEK